MTQSFSAQVDDAIANSNKNLLILIQSSVQDVVHMAQTPVAKGGRMRVVTGFLWSSGQASLTGVPSGPTRGSLTDENSYQFDASLASLTIAKMEIGSTLHFGWTADYAKYREMHDGFLETALQQWPQIVDRNANEILKRSNL